VLCKKWSFNALSGEKMPPYIHKMEQIAIKTATISVQNCSLYAIEWRHYASKSENNITQQYIVTFVRRILLLLFPNQCTKPQAC